jgi:hypothetical protein
MRTRASHGSARAWGRYRPAFGGRGSSRRSRSARDSVWPSGLQRRPLHVHRSGRRARTVDRHPRRANLATDRPAGRREPGPPDHRGPRQWETASPNSESPRIMAGPKVPWRRLRGFGGRSIPGCPGRDPRSRSLLAWQKFRSPSTAIWERSNANRRKRLRPAVQAP